MDVTLYLTNDIPLDLDVCSNQYTPDSISAKLRDDSSWGDSVHSLSYEPEVFSRDSRHQWVLVCIYCVRQLQQKHYIFSNG